MLLERAFCYILSTRSGIEESELIALLGVSVACMHAHMAVTSRSCIDESIPSRRTAWGWSVAYTCISIMHMFTAT